MSYFKSRLFIFFFFSFINISFANQFSSQSCLEAKFETEIINKGSLFGLLKKELKIIKDKCLVEIYYKNILPTKWIIDICREPIHLKVDSKGTLSVYKKKRDCNDINDDYCDQLDDLFSVIQDQGLIFAKGERESLESSHGKSYCIYLLLKRYLKEGYLFSQYKVDIDLFTNTEKKTQESKKIKQDIPMIIKDDNNIGPSSENRSSDNKESSEKDSEAKLDANTEKKSQGRF